ncbi:small lysine-rich protein 1 [Chironomus tepperi]|uniref:small lysine-rich protein 1 n=1 Tax=Chironomus tepperi TaxID=113505 RepID=UPI00391F2C4F
MGGKGKKKGKKQKQATASTGVAEEGGEENGEGNGGKKGKKGKKGKAGKSSKFQGDIFSEAAMENAYYVCHNLMDVLKARGFAWPESQKKKKKGKK